MTGRLGTYTGIHSPVSLLTARELVTAGPRQITREYDGNTADIVKSVLAVFESGRDQIAPLANALRGGNRSATIANVYAFVRTQIQYVLDTQKQQDVKTPARVVLDGYADCKGLSILTNALLAQLGIPCAFRFVAYGPGEFTHVYSLAGKTVLDTCLSEVGKEAAHHHSKDYMVGTSIRHISGIGNAEQEYGAVAGADDGTALGLHGSESDTEFELKLHREGLLLERKIAAAVCGVGGVGAYDEMISDYTRAIAAVSAGDGDALDGIADGVGRRYERFLAQRAGKPKPKAYHRWMRRKRRFGHVINGPEGETVEVSGIGRRKRRFGFFKKLANKVKNVAKGAARLAKKVGKGYLKVLKKVGKFALKAVTFPQRMFVKGLAEVILPKIAAMFLYLFIKNPTTIASLPPKVAKKRRKSEKFAKFMINTIGMKEKHFMKIIRNGIIRRYRVTPEVLLSRTVKGAISGIGLVGQVGGLYGIGEPVTIIITVVSLIQKLSKLFGKKPAEDETPGEGDLPDKSDFETGETESGRLINAEMETQPVTTRGEEPASPADHATEQAHQDRTLQRVKRQRESTPVDAPVPDDESESGGETPDGGDGGDGGGGFKRADAEGDAEADDENPEGGTRSRDGESPTGGGNSKMLLYGGAALAAMLLLGGKKGR
jgi:hypothetical protein